MQRRHSCYADVVIHATKWGELSFWTFDTQNARLKNMNFGEYSRHVHQKQACSSSDVASGSAAQQVMNLAPAQSEVFIHSSLLKLTKLGACEGSNGPRHGAEQVYPNFLLSKVH